MENKRCIILGGNGFIGLNLLKYLHSRGYSLTSFDREIPDIKIDKVKYIAGQFENDDLLLEVIKNQDIIIHLISTTNPGKSMSDPYSGYNIDIIQTIKILESIKESKARILFASSGGTVYGEPEQCPILEEHPLNPISHYGIIKVSIEKILIMYNQIYGMNNKIMRISNPYGPGQDYTRGVGIIDAIIKKGINNEKVIIWGDGSNIRDYIYIEDLCEAINLLIQYKGKYSIFNVSSCEGYTIKDIINIVEDVLDKSIEVEFQEKRKSDINHIYLENKRLCMETAFKLRYTLAQGIDKYICELKR